MDKSVSSEIFIDQNAQFDHLVQQARQLKQDLEIFLNKSEQIPEQKIHRMIGSVRKYFQRERLQKDKQDIYNEIYKEYLKQIRLEIEKSPSLTQSLRIINERPKDFFSSIKRALSHQESSSKDSYSKQYCLYNSVRDHENCFFKTIDKLLKEEKLFKSDNPKTLIGQYISARQGLHKNYELFQRSLSAMVASIKKPAIEPKDINQGEGTNTCYLLSAIASFVELHPSLMSRNFLFIQNPANYYVLKLFIEGRWRYVETDDKFPFVEGNEKQIPVYARPHKSEIWVMLVEKCYAQFFKSYESIQYGRVSEAFILITGAPCQKIQQNLQQKPSQQATQELIAKLKMSFNQSYPIAAISKPPSQKQRGHAYSVINIYSASEEETYVTARDPFGEIQQSTGSKFPGSFELIKKYGKEMGIDWKRNDSIFCLEINQFVRMFGKFYICKVRPAYVHTSRTFKDQFLKKEKLRLKMRVQVDGIYFVSIYQRLQKSENNSQSQQKYYELEMRLVSEDNLVELSQGKGKEYALSVEANLQGMKVYYVEVRRVSKETDSMNINIASYGPKTVEFENCVD